jgi:hypothetical protein
MKLALNIKKTNINNKLIGFLSKNLKYFSTSENLPYGFRYPDEIIQDLKIFFNNKNNQLNFYKIEESIVNNIHFFDADQFTDIVTILGKQNRGTPELWDLLNRKIYDYELNFVQARDMFNANIESAREHYEIEFKSMKTINSKNESSHERSTYDLLTSNEKI